MCKIDAALLRQLEAWLSRSPGRIRAGSTPRLHSLNNFLTAVNALCKDPRCAINVACLSRPSVFKSKVVAP